MAAEILLVPLAWTLVLCSTSRMYMLGRLLNALLLLAAVYLILNSTLLSRAEDRPSGLVSLPFQLLLSALKENREIMRSLLLNILLFCPFGAALANLLPTWKRVAAQIVAACMAGAILSTLMEWMQYLYSLGSAEADDVICNTLGTLVGAMSLPLKKLFAKMKSN